MPTKAQAQRVVKANDALTRAKNDESTYGAPVPKKLRDELKAAVKEYENN